ncbi:MAG TPA: class II fructose-1,6-bisphosphate aldolase [Candidatus Eisenbacteria bacterium]|nr:class II fructose-1,6-bisphosphate aldolase [Candidatus Eisenbacteria bacterium]
MLTTLKKILAAADKGGYAVGAFNVNNLEIVQAVIETAVEKRSPVIIQTSEGAIEYAGMPFLIALIRTAALAPVPVVMHLDHGKDLKVIKRAIDSGYTSVMFDGSLYKYDENVAKTKKVVGWAKPKGVSVEAEIGAIKGVEDLVSVSEKQAFFTDPGEAGRFAKATGCDALAISIGTAHGAYKSKTAPTLDIERLKKIDAAVKVPIVLHGASGISAELVAKTKSYCETLEDCSRLEGAIGIPDDQILAAIKHGVRKINIDSDLRIAFTAGLRETIVTDHKAIDPRKLLALSKRLMKEVVAHKMDLFGSTGKAKK